jgi:hypothetical protein
VIEEPGTPRFGTVRFGTVRFGAVGFSTVRLGTVRLGTVRLGTVRLGTVRLGTVRLGTLKLGTVRFSTAESGTAKIGCASGVVSVAGDVWLISAGVRLACHGTGSGRLVSGKSRIVLGGRSSRELRRLDHGPGSVRGWQPASAVGGPDSGISKLLAGELKIERRVGRLDARDDVVGLRTVRVLVARPLAFPVGRTRDSSGRWCASGRCRTRISR